MQAQLGGTSVHEALGYLLESLMGRMKRCTCSERAAASSVDWQEGLMFDETPELHAHYLLLLSMRPAT